MTIAKRRVAAVRPMTGADLRQATSIHKASLDSGYFVELGPKFLSAYYETFMDSPHGIALVATLDGVVVGTLVGTTDNAEQYRWVAQNRKRRMARIGALQLLRRPRLFYRFLRTRAVRYGRWLLRASKNTTVVDVRDAPAGCLTHVAVDQACRGTGVGGQLVNEFVRLARTSGRAKRLVLVTRKNENGARSFYTHLGWSITGTKSDLDSRQYVHMQLDLEEA